MKFISYLIETKYPLYTDDSKCLLPFEFAKLKDILGQISNFIEQLYTTKQHQNPNWFRNKIHNNFDHIVVKFFDWFFSSIPIRSIRFNSTNLNFP